MHAQDEAVGPSSGGTAATGRAALCGALAGWLGGWRGVVSTGAAQLEFDVKTGFRL